MRDYLLGAFMGAVFILLLFFVVACSSTQVPIPVVIKPTLLACPALEYATEGDVFQRIADTITEYQQCKAQTDIWIKYLERK